MAQADYLEIGGGEQLAYRRLKGSGTGVTFLCGHGSDMDGTKALEVEAWARDTGRSCLRELDTLDDDVGGHGLHSSRA